MRPKTKDIDLIDVDPDGLATAQAVAGAGDLTLNGALISDSKWVASDGMARVITILSAGDDTGITFTVTGSYGNIAKTEVITGANADTATGAVYMNTVTAITASGAAAGNVSAGIGEECVTNPVPVNHYNSDAPTVSIEVITDTIDITVEETLSEIQDTSKTTEWYPVSALSNISVKTRADVTNHVYAVRGKVNNYTSGAECQMVIQQNAMR